MSDHLVVTVGSGRTPVPTQRQEDSRSLLTDSLFRSNQI